MTNNIIVKGIQTNNLKNIDIELMKNEINLLIGPSGSGKSSLAYDTIAQIGLHELNAMYYDSVNEPSYRVSSFENMIVTVPLEQNNLNTNTRSTIGTYFSINAFIAKIYSVILGMPYEYFVLNKSDNVCTECLGVGTIKNLDPYKIVDLNKSAEEVPLRCWSKNKEFYKQIITSFCKDNDIPINEKYRNLSDEHQNLILYGTGDKKYKIKYKTANRIAERTTCYYGPLVNKPMMKGFSPSEEFYSESPCSVCNGEKFNIDHRKFKVAGYSIGELMVLPFDKFEGWLTSVENREDFEELKFSVGKIREFVNKAIELKLGYLYLNRSIPSLSGGELQRLRLIQVLNSQLSDLLIILDEPLAGLSKNEKGIVFDNIVALKDKHTLLIVDHHDLFIPVAKKIYALGKGGGIYGGEIVDAFKYIEEQSNVRPIQQAANYDNLHIATSKQIYSYTGLNIDFAKGNMNLITGSSGVGKSTILREYLPRMIDDYLYISQKSIVGKNNSTLATYLNIADRISRMFSREFDKEKSFFSNQSTSSGSCKVCNGTGKIVYGTKLQGQIEIQCKHCKGTGFSKQLDKFKINGKSIADVWNMTIDEGVDYFFKLDKSIYDTLLICKQLLIGHLRIGSNTSTLSGGENVRIKIITALTAKYMFLGIDEPFRGLNQKEIQCVAVKLQELTLSGKTVIVADHEEKSVPYFAKCIEIVNHNGILTEKI